MHRILIDWGTTNFRAYLVDSAWTLVATHTSVDGIKASSGRYEDVLRSNVAAWVRDFPVEAIMAAGMIGSDLGWFNVPVLRCPTKAADVAANMQRFAISGLPPLLIVPGLWSSRGEDDIGMMRGEEVLIFGAMNLLGHQQGDFCLPGTHSKWVRMRGQAVETIETCMTGEVFDLIRTHSVLGNGMRNWDGTLIEGAFARGLATAKTVPNPIRSLFSLRTMRIRRDCSDAEMASYLSGLFIGTEVQSFLNEIDRCIVIVASDRLSSLYGKAANFFGMEFERCNDAMAFIAGTRILAEQISRHPA